MKNNTLIKSFSIFMAALMSFSFISFLRTENVSAKDENISGEAYVFSEKGEFNSKKSIRSYKTDSKDEDSRALGKVTLSGDFKKIEGMDNGFYVNEGNITVSYKINTSYRLNDYNEEDWHIYEKDNAKKVEGIELKGKNKSGVIIVRSSFDGEEWCTDEILLDQFSKDKDAENTIYSTNSIQLVSGCHYQIIIAYKMEKKTGAYAVGKVELKDKHEYRRIEEIYEFYAEGEDKEVFESVNAKNHEKDPYHSSDLIKTDDEYYGNQTIELKDPMYSRSIGEFTVKGFTSFDDTNKENVIFEKTGADRIAVSFNLEEKNIDKLFGSKDLKINYDTANDKELQIEKQEFKRGTLIVKFTDTRNKKKDPIVYTNFLEACTTTKADTKILLFEEGSYEIVLDFEILDESKTPDKKTNYKMKFNFEVVNGNAKAFFVNTTTSELLDNNAVITDAFKIDFANSKKLKANCIYYKYTLNDNQIKETIVSNNAVADGDIFEKSGKYVFTVSSDAGSKESEFVVYVANDKYTKAITQPDMDLESVNQKLKNGYKINEDGSLSK